MTDSDKYFYAKEKWLKENGYSQGDVIEDEDGEEFVYDFYEDGTRIRRYIKDLI